MPTAIIRTIDVRNPVTHVHWHELDSPLTDHYQQLFQRIRDNLIDAPSVGVLTATLIPVRTHNFIDFSIDFFLPTTINQAMKVHTVALKVFAVIIALVLDAVTFPIRLATCIPRCIRNAWQEEHPIHNCLREEGVPLQVLDSGIVEVRLTTYYSEPDVLESSRVGSVRLIELPDTGWADAINLIF